MLSSSQAINRPAGKSRTVLSMVRGMFCRHQWDMSRSRKGTYVCRSCGARKA